MTEQWKKILKNDIEIYSFKNEEIPVFAKRFINSSLLLIKKTLFEELSKVTSAQTKISMCFKRK